MPQTLKILPLLGYVNGPSRRLGVRGHLSCCVQVAPRMSNTLSVSPVVGVRHLVGRHPDRHLARHLAHRAGRHLGLRPDLSRRPQRVLEPEFEPVLGLALGLVPVLAPSHWLDLRCPAGDRAHLAGPRRG